MKKTLLQFVIALVGIWVSAMIGYRVGSNKSADFFLRQEMSSNLNELSSDIKVAGILKSNQKEKAEELLDVLIDVRVSSLVLQADQKSFAPMRKEILDSIMEAKIYRTKWPVK